MANMRLNNFKINITKTPEITFSIKTLLVFVISFLFFLIINYVYLRWSSYNQIQQSLKDTTNRIVKDLVFKDGRWNTSSYVNDTQISQSNPLYVITADGFIIDRESPIKGLLDTSDFKFNSSFSSPQTITTPAGEQWRMYSKTISKGSTILGVITVGYYQPEPEAIADIDNQLQDAVSTISSEINTNGEVIDASSVNPKDVSIKISYEVVDSFNHALQSVGGLPTYIDRSYLSNFTQEKDQLIEDNHTKEKFEVYSQPIMDTSNHPIGVVVSGYQLKQVNQVLHNQLVFSTLSGVVIAILTTILLAYLLRDELSKMAEEVKTNLQKSLSILGGYQGLMFDKDKSIIKLDELEFKVPYASYQYDICKVLFSKPTKRWELDEMLDKMGEKYDDLMPRQVWRKIYDAVRLLNEKGSPIFGTNIILTETKTFRVNTQIQPQKS